MGWVFRSGGGEGGVGGGICIGVVLLVCRGRGGGSMSSCERTGDVCGDVDV